MWIVFILHTQIAKQTSDPERPNGATVLHVMSILVDLLINGKSGIFINFSYKALSQKPEHDTLNSFKSPAHSRLFLLSWFINKHNYMSCDLISHYLIGMVII